MGQTFGWVHPLTSEFMWYVDCKEIRRDYIPTKVARLPINIRGGPREPRYMFMFGEVMSAEDLLDAVEGDEEEPMVVDPIPVIAMAGAVSAPAPTLRSPTYFDDLAFQSPQATATREKDMIRNEEAAARLHAAYARARPAINPTSEWTGGEWKGASPINMAIRTSQPSGATTGVLAYNCLLPGEFRVPTQSERHPGRRSVVGSS